MRSKMDSNTRRKVDQYRVQKKRYRTQTEWRYYITERCTLRLFISNTHEMNRNDDKRVR